MIEAHYWKVKAEVQEAGTDWVPAERSAGRGDSALAVRKRGGGRETLWRRRGRVGKENTRAHAAALERQHILTRQERRRQKHHARGALPPMLREAIKIALGRNFGKSEPLVYLLFKVTVNGTCQNLCLSVDERDRRCGAAGGG